MLPFGFSNTSAGSVYSSLVYPCRSSSASPRRKARRTAPAISSVVTSSPHSLFRQSTTIWVPIPLPMSKNLQSPIMSKPTMLSLVWVIPVRSDLPSRVSSP
jgi:hypothetical protein